MFRPNIKRSLLQLIGYSPQHTNPIISCLLDQVNKFTPEVDNWSAEHLIEEIKITKAFSLETLEDFINAPTGDPAVYPTDLNTITKENYLLDLASKSLKSRMMTKSLRRRSCVRSECYACSNTRIFKVI
mgnify:CR=1 FL=1